MMKNISMLVLLVLFFSACSQRVVSVKAECKELESKLVKLEQEKKLNLAGKVAQVAFNGYPTGPDEVKLNQNIKVLKLKLDECNRK